MSTLLSVSIAALAGLLMTRVFNLWRLPDVTAYLVAGVLIGPYVLGSMHITGLGLVSAEAVSSLHLVSEVALGFIAFSIGNEFRLEDLKSTGNQAAIIGVVQALTATLLVDTALLTVHMLLPEKLSVAQTLKTFQLLTAINAELLFRLAKSSALAHGAENDACDGCHWEKECFQDVLPLCMLAEAGIDPEEGDFECAVKDGTLVLRSDADTNVYEMMKSLDDDFRDLLKSAGVSLSGLFLLLKEELDHDE